MPEALQAEIIVRGGKDISVTSKPVDGRHKIPSRMRQWRGRAFQNGLLA